MDQTADRSARSVKTGLPPGTLIHIGESSSEALRLWLIRYTPDRFEESQPESAALPPGDVANGFRVLWLNLDGLSDLHRIEEIGTRFNLHPLVLEDVVNTEQRPKCEDYESHLYIVVKMLRYALEDEALDSEQVSLVLTKDAVISFQERPGDVFDVIRDRLRQDKGRIRREGPDYLAYSLLDAIVDHYFVVLERIGDRIEDIQEELDVNPTPAQLHAIHDIKRQLIFMRKAIWPLRDSLSTLQRAESSLIQRSTRLYLRDVYDHSVQIMDSVETYRDMVSGLTDLYMSSIGNRMNEIMKVLTMIATVFIPLTFIAGIYGMNFRIMPERDWAYGYPACLALMAMVAFSMALFFRRRKWL